MGRPVVAHLLHQVIVHDRFRIFQHPVRHGVLVANHAFSKFMDKGIGIKLVGFDPVGIEFRKQVDPGLIPVPFQKFFKPFGDPILSGDPGQPLGIVHGSPALFNAK